MEVRDGFIVGVFNYCDRWCERCALTSYCLVFADHAELQASLDPNLKEVSEAPSLPEEEPPPPPPWLQHFIDEANRASSEPMSPEEWERLRPRVPADHEPIVARAKDYALRTYRWLTSAERQPERSSDDLCDVISWFHFFIAAKVQRALTVWPDAAVEDRSWPSDADGSAKTALLGIDQSHAAWLELVGRGVLTSAEAHEFIADLVWLGESLEAARPRARAFVRPGFDEPDAVARLLSADRR
jgi:hypothetical protein